MTQNGSETTDDPSELVRQEENERLRQWKAIVEDILREAYEALGNTDLLGGITQLQAYLREANAEVERLRAHDAQMTTQVVNLKVEVERLRFEWGETTAKLSSVENLEAEVERLRAVVLVAASIDTCPTVSLGQLEAMALEALNGAT